MSSSVRTSRTVPAVLLFCLFAFVNLFAQNFSTTDYTVGSGPQKLVRGDFNHDGKLDLATGNDDGTITVLVNNGDGTFHRLDATAGSGAVIDLTAIDINKDGYADLLALLRNTDDMSASLVELIGRGDGTFDAPQPIAVRENGAAIVAADFNGDGNIDIALGWNHAVSNSSGGLDYHANVTLLFGDGTSGFPNTSEMTNVGAQADFANGESGYQIRYMTVGDFNGDGKHDFFIAECCGGFDVELGDTFAYLNNGSGAFTGKELGGAPPFEARVFDIDKNGISDVMVPYSGCHTPCTGAHVIFNPGLSSSVGQDVPDPFEQTAGGGSADLYDSITAGQFVTGAPRMAVYSARGTRYDPPTFLNNYEGSVLAFATWNGSSWTLVKSIDLNERAMKWLTSGDFDGDGLDDLAGIDASQGITGVVRVMRNTGSSSGGSCSATSNRTVKICAPANGSTVSSPVRVLAGLRSDSGVNAAQIYVDGSVVYQGAAGTTTLDKSLSLTAGSHRITVKGWDASGSFSSTVNITVGDSGGGTCSASTNRMVKICSPANGGAVSSPVQVLAGLRSDSGVTAAQIYVDGTKVYQGAAGTTIVNQSLSLSPGTHRITVKGWDSAGSFSSSVNITVVSSATTCSASTNRAVNICTPTNSSTDSSPVHVLAGLRSDSGVSAAKVYLDGNSVYTSGAGTTTIDQLFSISAGSHRLTIKGWDNSGSFSSSIVLTVP